MLKHIWLTIKEVNGNLLDPQPQMLKVKHIRSVYLKKDVLFTCIFIQAMAYILLPIHKIPQLV